MDEHKQKELLAATVSGIWFGAVVLLATLFITAGLQGSFTVTHFILIGIILALAVIGTPLAIYGLRDKGEDIAKAKRQRIDAMLRDMTDEELLELQQRLANGDYSDETILEFVSDDGEMILRS